MTAYVQYHHKSVFPLQFSTHAINIYLKIWVVVHCLDSCWKVTNVATYKSGSFLRGFFFNPIKPRKYSYNIVLLVNSDTVRQRWNLNITIKDPWKRKLYHILQKIQTEKNSPNFCCCCWNTKYLFLEDILYAMEWLKPIASFGLLLLSAKKPLLCLVHLFIIIYLVSGGG